MTVPGWDEQRSAGREDEARLVGEDREYAVWCPCQLVIGVGVPFEPVARAHREVRDEDDRVFRAGAALTVWQHKLAGYPDCLAPVPPYGHAYER